MLLDLSVLGRYEANVFDDGAAEIVAYDAPRQQVFVVNAAATTVDVLDISNPAAPALIGTIDASAEGGGANSVAVSNGIVAVAIEAEIKTDPGSVVFYSATTRLKLGEALVGALPDMVTFTPDGLRVLVANEGEPNDDYSIDPEGSISIVTVNGGTNPVAVTAGFGAFNGQEEALREAGVRLFGFNTPTVAEDLEPEYIAVSPDGLSAFATLQENNAFAKINLATNTVTEILPLGFKDHRILGNELDASDRDGPNLRNWPVLGMYLPDTVASYLFNGRTYYVTANEGDAREYDPFEEEARIEDLLLDATAFPNAADLQQDAAIGRLNATTTLGDTDNDGDFDELYVFGGRSFSIWADDGTQVFDSGSEFERITALRFGANFNNDNTENDGDSRSDAKGPEPEAVAVAQIAGRTFAFVGLERMGGIMVYDVTNPQNARFVQYINQRDFSVDIEQAADDGDSAAAGDLGPEGLAVIPADQSPISGVPLLAVGNEISGTTTLYRIDVIELD